MLGGITGEELEAYAEANGLQVMSHRSAYDWAKALNRNNGLCPCGKVCPCENCTCKFYEQKSENEEQTTGEPTIMIQNEEIAGAVETLENTKDLLISLSDKGITKEEALNTLQEAEKMILKDAEGHKCRECTKYMEGFARKINFLKAECEKDPVACNLERNDALHRIDVMQQTFVSADQDITREEEEQKKKQTLDASEKEEKPKTVLESNGAEVAKPFHECVRDSMSELAEEIPDRPTRLCTSTKRCGKNTLMEKDAALAECLKNKEEKENGQNSS